MKLPNNFLVKNHRAPVIQLILPSNVSYGFAQGIILLLCIFDRCYLNLILFHRNY